MADWLWAVMFVCSLALGAVLGHALLRQRDEQRERRQEEERARERQEQQQHLEQLRETMRDSFARLAQEALDRNAAQQSERLDSTLRPVRETLRQTREKLDEIEKERHAHYGSLKQQLEAAVQAENQLRRETQNLSRALASPNVRGAYGEITLRRLIELAGMVPHCDFVEQEKTERRRPDVVVRMPGDRVLPIDAKAPLEAYLEAHREQDPQRQRERLKAFAAQMRLMVLDLARKEYWAEFDNALDFVVMFVPGDQFLNAALEQLPELMDEALGRRVLLATPSSLMAILRAVAYGWNQQQLAENAEQIRGLGRDLHDRVATFLSHLGKIGRNLGGGVDAYNKAVGSWQSRVQPVLTKFRELGAEGRDSDPPEELSALPRSAPAPDARDDAA